MNREFEPFLSHLCTDRYFNVSMNFTGEFGLMLAVAGMVLYSTASKRAFVLVFVAAGLIHMIVTASGLLEASKGTKTYKSGT